MPDESSFKVSDDSVVATLSVDVRAGSADELHQINQQAEQLKVNLEAVARAQSSWLEYLSQVPQLTEQAAQAQRNLITQLERTSYIQQEMGGYASVGASGGGGGAPAGQYSTAAPQGYVNPFGGATSGLGVAAPQGSSQAESTMQSMMMNDPRLFANMLAQRGMNPATLGMMGQAATPGGTGGSGMGASPPASASPQATQAARDSAAPPDPTQSGQTTKAEPQNIPETPHPDAPAWQQAVQQVQKMGRSVVNESRGGGGRGSLLGMAGAGMQAIASRGGGGGGGGDDGDPTGMGLGKMAKGIGVAGGLVTAALGVNKLVQNAGEQIQGYRNLGGERGGGAVEGAGYEVQARMMAMNPFITLEQSRQIMQSGLRSGYTGKEFETVTQMMAQNLKDMNMSAADSMNLYNDTVRFGGQSIQDFKKNMKDLHDLAATGFVGQTEKVQQNVQTANVTGELGFEGGAARELNQTITEGFAGNAMLAHVMPEAVDSAMQNPLFMTYLGREAGITDLPDAIPGRLSEKGPHAASQALDSLLRKQAMKAHGSSPNNEPRAVAFFKAYMAQMGLTLQQREATELYRFVMGGGSASKFGQQRVSEAHGRKTKGESIPGMNVIEDLSEFEFGKAWSDFTAIFTGGGGSEEEEQSGPPQYPQGGRSAPVTARSSPYAPAGRPAPAIPTTAGPGTGGGGGGGMTHGVVNGELRVVVDQQGRVTAPDTVRLSGNQIAVNSGYGGATLNNPSPGDLNYRHDNSGMGR